jgi:regulatory protein
MKKIINYKNKKSNLYEITFDNNEKITLFDDVILKYELLLKKELDDKLLKSIIDDNNNLESYYKALKYLNVRLRTEKEIRKKLKDYSKTSVDYTINRLKKEGYLNDNLYIKSYINDEVNLKIVGQNKILFDLKKAGFKKEDINNYLNTIDNAIWLNKIDKYIQKSIAINHNLSAYLLTQKIIKDLMTKGFYKEDIISIIDKYDIVDDNSIYEKEYNKIKNKLSRKYSGEELEYRIKINLIKKGFKKSINDLD